MSTKDMNRERWEVRLLGTRGSMAVTEPKCREFGGDTLCVQVGIGDLSIFFDAGTGIMHGDAREENCILIGHPHLDHLIGLGKWTQLADPSKKMKIYMADHEGMTCSEILHRLYGPPFWPIPLENVSKGLEYVSFADGDTFYIGDIKVQTQTGNHPGAVTHYRLSDGERSLVYAVDNELTPEEEEKLYTFAKDCDLLICDGQWMEEDVSSKRGWGHSSVVEAAKLGEKCNAGETVLVHFDPATTDEMIREVSGKMKKCFPKCSFGREGEIRYL